MAETVTVASKLAHDLILDLADPAYAGIVGADLAAKKVLIKGNAPVRDPEGKTLDEDYAETAGAALTFGVPKDFWDAWSTLYAKFPAYERGFIFAHVKTENVKAEAKEKKDVKTGLERLDKDAQKAYGVTDAKDEKKG